jgi:hypothetical protein
MRTTRKAWSLLGPVLVAMGCGYEQPDDAVEVQTSALTSVSYFYLRCNVTSWELNTASYMAPTTADGALRTLEFNVEEEWELTGNTCQPMSTDVFGQWGPANAVYTTIHGAVTAPGGDLLNQGYPQFNVRFPHLGRYRATINASNGSFQVEEVSSVHRGLAVITNFQNRTIANGTQAGIKSPADLRTILDQMENHWKWLSRGKEVMKWDILQITLPKPLDIRPCNTNADCSSGETCQYLQDVEDGRITRSWNQCEPFSWWGDYRQQVISATLAELNRTGTPMSRYDSDNDGDIDAIWSVAADNGVRTSTIIGGTSWHQGGHIFVDGQSPQSVPGQYYGNFNHELGHCRDLPDLYGPYTTVGTITLMAYSWLLPGNDFDAYCRTKLGWASPRVITNSSWNVQLVSADQDLDVVEVPTASAGEYFLIEYRVTPHTGYGSAAPSLNGLIVYHVKADSNQWSNPPLLKVEPADGVLPFDSTADQTDVLTPTNVTSQSPFIARTYAGAEVFRITGVRSGPSAAMSFDISINP